MPLKGDTKTIAKLQRKASRQAEIIIGLLEKNSNLHHEVERIEDTLVRVWFLLDGQTDPRDVRGMIERKIPNRMAKVKERDARRR